jgi:hypothetical protein
MRKDCGPLGHDTLQSGTQVAVLQKDLLLQTSVWIYETGTKDYFTDFMLGWLCIMNYVHNNQLDAPFVLSLLN